jgi:hypothetical protein
MIYSSKVCLGPSYWIVKILIRSIHLVFIEIARIEQIESNTFETAIPTFRVAARPSTRKIRQQSVSQGIAVMIESHYPVGHEDMVAGEAIARDDALGVKARKWCVPQKHSSENGTRAISKEYPIQLSPTTDGVLLYARFAVYVIDFPLRSSSSPISRG